MSTRLLAVLVFLVTARGAAVTAKSCNILFDGRIPLDAQPSDFDKNTSIYDHQFVHGENQTWAEVLKFPPVPQSLFDLSKKSKPIEVTINDNSIFVPGGGPPQTGFRRSELIPALNNGTDITVQGTTTSHWSVRFDPARPLNFSHEYHPVWHETNDYSTSQITFQTGTPFNASFEDGGVVHDPRTLRLAGRQSNSPETIFFQTPFTEDVWHNFAVTLGWTDNTLSFFYSQNFEPLQRVVGPTFNNNSGGGQFHVGTFKEPTGPLGIDVLYDGYQEEHLNEGLIFGGVFIEDSSDGCVTTSLADSIA